jgi:hypothetical protein
MSRPKKPEERLAPDVAKQSLRRRLSPPTDFPGPLVLGNFGRRQGDGNRDRCGASGDITLQSLVANARAFSRGGRRRFYERENGILTAGRPNLGAGLNY